MFASTVTTSNPTVGTTSTEERVIIELSYRLEGEVEQQLQTLEGKVVKRMDFVSLFDFVFGLFGGFGDGDNIVWGTSNGIGTRQSTAAILE